MQPWGCVKALKGRVAYQLAGENPRNALAMGTLHKKGPYELTKATLVARLQHCCSQFIRSSKTQASEYLLQVTAAGVVSQEELQATSPKSTSTIKNYLYSTVTYRDTRERIDRYMRAHSRLWVYGGYLSTPLVMTSYNSQYFTGHEGEPLPG